MNKAEFIEELDNRIAVLTEEERRDILDEYEQHIDMKTMRGMSEEAAIADFGRMEELAADILEAYHVRIDYASVDKRKRMRHRSDREQYAKNAPSGFGADGEETGDLPGRQSEKTAVIGHMYEGIWRGTKAFCGKVSGGVKRAARTLGCGMHKTADAVRTQTARAVHVCRLPFGRKGSKEAGHGETGNTERTGNMKRKGRFFPGRIFERMFDACLSAVCFCLRWIWNFFWGGCGILFGFASCIVIFTMGTLAVLLALGYPLFGVALGWLGLTLCTVSVTIWCFSLLLVKRKEGAKSGGQYGKKPVSHKYGGKEKKEYICREKEGKTGEGEILPAHVTQKEEERADA